MVDMVRAGAPALATSEVPVTGPRPAPEQAPSVLPTGLPVDRVLAFFDVDDAEHRAGKVATFQVLALLGLAVSEVHPEIWVSSIL